MKEDDIELDYMDMIGFKPGLVCPGCGVQFMEEAIVADEIRKSEAEIEAKFS
jgi:hypothetical protein